MKYGLDNIYNVDHMQIAGDYYGHFTRIAHNNMAYMHSK